MARLAPALEDDLMAVHERHRADGGSSISFARARSALWQRVVGHGRFDLIPDLAAACEASGSSLSAALLVHDGERRFASGDVAGAVAQFEAAVEDDPTSAEAWNDLGVARHALGHGDAVGALTTGLAVAGDGPSDCLANRAMILFELGRVAESRRDARSAIDAGRSAPELHAILAATTELLGGLDFEQRMRIAA